MWSALYCSCVKVIDLCSYYLKTPFAYEGEAKTLRENIHFAEICVDTALVFTKYRGKQNGRPQEAVRPCGKGWWWHNMLHKRYKNREMLSGWTSTWHRRQIPSIQLSPESALLLDYTLKMPSSSLNTSNLFYVDPLHVVLTKINLQKKTGTGASVSAPRLRQNITAIVDRSKRIPFILKEPSSGAMYVRRRRKFLHVNRSTERSRLW